MTLRKPTKVRSRSYLDFIRGKGCLICGRKSEAAHTGSHGLSTKADDIRCVPLCGEHHRGPYGLDRNSRFLWENNYGIDLNETILTLLAEYIADGGRF